MDPRGNTGVPPKEMAKEEDTPPASRHLNRTEHRPLLLRARSAPGGLPSQGSLSGEMLHVALDFGPLALGPRRVNLARMYEW